MTDEAPKELNHTDARLTAEHGSSIASIRLVGFDRPFFTAIAVAIAMGAMLLAFYSEREARMAEYYAVDVEVCIIKGICPNPSGAKVPADPWRSDK